VSSYAVGQVWQYRARPGEESSDLVIHRIELVRSIEVLHISVRGLRIRNPHTDSGYQERLPHTPIARAALDASVTTMIAHGVPDDDGFERGYAKWREEKGGVFTVTVAEIIDVLERALATPRAT
jgi:hypothetical protein